MGMKLCKSFSILVFISCVCAMDTEDNAGHHRISVKEMLKKNFSSTKNYLIKKFKKPKPDRRLMQLNQNCFTIVLCFLNPLTDIISLSRTSKTVRGNIAKSSQKADFPELLSFFIYENARVPNFATDFALFTKEIIYFQEKNSYVLTVNLLNNFFFFENQLVGAIFESSFLSPEHNEMGGYRLVTPDYCGTREFPGGKTFHFKIGLYHFVFVNDTVGSLTYRGYPKAICTKINPKRFLCPYEFESDSLELSTETLLVYGQGNWRKVYDKLLTEVKTYFYYTILTDPKQITKFKTMRQDFAGFCWFRNKMTGFVPADQLDNFE